MFNLIWNVSFGLEYQPMSYPNSLHDNSLLISSYANSEMGLDARKLYFVAFKDSLRLYNLPLDNQTCNRQRFNNLANLCSWASQSEASLVANLEYGVSRVAAEIVALIESSRPGHEYDSILCSFYVNVFRSPRNFKSRLLNAAPACI